MIKQNKEYLLAFPSKILKQIVILLSAFILTASRIQDISSYIIFSRDPQSRLDFNNVMDPQAKTSSTIIEAIQTTNNHIYIKMKGQGIQIYNLSNIQSKSFLELDNNTQPIAFSVSNNDTKLFYSIQNQVFAIEIEIVEQDLVVVKSKIKCQYVIDSSVKQIFQNESGTNIYVYGDSQIGLYDDLLLKQLRLFDAKEAIKVMKISLEGNYIYFLSSQNGLISLRVIQVNGQGNLEEIGGVYQQSQLNDFVVSNDNNWVYGVDLINQQILLINISPVYEQYSILGLVKLTQWQTIWPSFLGFDSIITQIKFSADSNFLILGIRSQGIIILDVSVRNSPEFYYTIDFAEISQFLDFNGNKQDQLIVSDLSTILIFSNQIINISSRIPNLFNSHQAQLFPLTNTKRCVQFNPGLLLTTSSKGIDLYSFYSQSNLKIQSQFHLDSSTQDLIIDKVSATAIVSSSSQQNLLELYQIDLDNNNANANPKLTYISSVVNPNNYQLTFGNLVRSKDGKLIVAAYGNGFLLFDSKSFPSIILKKQINFFNDQVDSLDITRDNKWIICTQRSQGQYGFVDISDENNITIKNIYRTGGVEGVVTSSIGDYAYLYDGSKGFSILNTLKLPEISIISSLKTKGWSNYINIFSNEEYIILSSISTDMIQLINIQDKQNPYIISKFKSGLDKGYSSCLSQSENTLYIMNQTGFRSLPIQTKLLFHQQLYIFNSNQNQFVEINNNSNLQIGSSYSINLIPLYPPQGMVIYDVFYYQNFNNMPLPNWIKFSYQENILFIEGNKLGLGYYENEPPIQKENIILLQVQIPLSNDSFIFTQSADGVDITPQESNQIHIQLQQKGYIIPRNLANKQFFSELDNINIQLPGFTSDQTSTISELVKRKLLESIQIVPIVFTIESSLKINFDNPKYIIHSLSPNIACTLLVDVTEGQFIKKNYKGVLTSTNDQANQIQFEGSLNSINQILYEKIIFFNKINLDQIQLNITIIDSLNYNLQLQVSLSDPQVQLIQIKSPVKLKKKLQNQLENLYPNGQLQIESQIIIDFDMDTFEVSDPHQVQFIILMKTEPSIYNLSSSSQSDLLTINLINQASQGFQQIPSDFWLRADTIKLQLSGFASTSLFGNYYQFKILATDGYTIAEDTFEISLNGIPISLILLLILQIGGPLLSILLIYNYRNSIFNLYIQKKWGNKYIDEIFVNQHYVKRIVIIGDELKKANKLLIAMIQFIINNKEVFNNFYKQNYVNIEKDNIKFEKQSTSLQNQLEIKFQNINLSKTRKSITNSYLKLIIPQNEDCQTQTSNKKIEDKYKPLSSKKINATITATQLTNRSASLSPTNPSKTKNQSNEILQKLLLLFIDPNSKIVNLEKILYFLKRFQIEFTFDQQLYSTEQYENLLLDQTSVFHYCFLSCISQYLMKLDTLTYQTYSHMKKLVKLYYCSNKNQKKYQTNSPAAPPPKMQRKWYNKYVSSRIQYSSSSEISSKPFPDITYNSDLVLSDIMILLEDVSQIVQNKDNLQSMQQNILKKIQFGLIKEVLVAKKLGLIKGSKFFSFPFLECSLHVKNNEIDSVECYRDEPSISCYKFRKCLHLSTYQFLLQKNTNLMPYWMKLEVKNQNNIIIYGSPSLYEQDDLQIRIYDTNRLIISQFNLTIKQKELKQINFSQRNNSNQNPSYQLVKRPSALFPLQLSTNQSQYLEESQKSFNNNQDQNPENALTQSQKLRLKRKSSQQRSSFQVSSKLNQINELEDRKIELKKIKSEEDTMELDKGDESPFHLYFSQHKKFKRKETIQI